jgi:hypothetical protein
VRGRERGTGGAEIGLGAMAEKPTRKEMGLKLWVIGFHGAQNEREEDWCRL